MTENDLPHSGSRWEPASADATTPAAEWRTAAAAGDVHDLPADTTTQVPPAGRGAGRARRGLLVGAGAGILVIGGVGGFAAGHAFAGTGDGGGSPAVVQNGIPGQNGVPGEGFGDGDGFHDRDGDHGGFDGAAPGDGSGQRPAAPSAGGGGTDDGTSGGNA